MRGQSPILINEFKGYFSRGSQDLCPLNYAVDCLNLEFPYRRVKTRGEFIDSYTYSAFTGVIIGLYLFPRLDGTTRRLILHRETGTGTVRLVDLDHTVSPPFVVATYSTDIDSVSVIPMFDRLYIAQLTTNNEHKIDAVVQVYDGTAVARNAAGVAPTGAAMVATEPGAGNVSAGIHLYAVCFETPSGFLTKAGPAAWTNKTSAGSKNINLAGIPTGPAGTVNRYILATKLIPTYGPPQENFELFFVPTGLVAGNVTTTLTFDFFDTELVDSADYLLDQLETIPAGPLFSIGNSLGVAGYKQSSIVGPGSTGNKSSVALISKAVEVEAFSADAGFVVVVPSKGGALCTALDLNGTLFFFKEGLTAAIQPNLDDSPANWGSPGVIDSVIGSTPFGIAQYMGAPYIINGGAFIMTRFGLQHFNGAYNNLSFPISDVWAKINSFKFFKNSIATVNPDDRRVYMFLAKGAGYADTFLVMDYKEGFTPETVKWCPWTNASINLRGMAVDKDGLLQVSITGGKLQQLQLTAQPNVETISSYLQVPLRFSELGYIYNYEHVLIAARGAGSLVINWYSRDAVVGDATNPILILAATAEKMLRRLGNFSSQLATLKLANTGASRGYFDITSIIAWGHQESEEYPE